MQEKSLKNLELLKDTDDSKVQAERGRKGGLAKSPAKTIAYFRKKSCNRCKLPCPLKDQGKEEGWKCKVPDAKRMILEAASDPNKLIGSILGDVLEMQLMAKTVKDKNLVASRKLELKRELWPNTQKHEVVNANININPDEVLKFYEETRKRNFERQKHIEGGISGEEC